MQTSTGAYGLRYCCAILIRLLLWHAAVSPGGVITECSLLLAAYAGLQEARLTHAPLCQQPIPLTPLLAVATSQGTSLAQSSGARHVHRIVARQTEVQLRVSSIKLASHQLLKSAQPTTLLWVDVYAALTGLPQHLKTSLTTSSCCRWERFAGRSKHKHKQQLGCKARVGVKQQPHW